MFLDTHYRKHCGDETTMYLQTIENIVETRQQCTCTSKHCLLTGHESRPRVKTCSRVGKKVRDYSPFSSLGPSQRTSHVQIPLALLSSHQYKVYLLSCNNIVIIFYFNIQKATNLNEPVSHSTVGRSCK